MLASQSGNMSTILTDTLAAAAGRKLILGPGTFVVDGASIELGDYANIEGSGRGNTIIEFRNVGGGHGFHATNKVGIRLSGLTVRCNVALTGNQVAVNLNACNDCILTDVEQSNFSGGLWFVHAGGPDDTWNQRNKAIGCISRNSQSYGFHISGGTACQWDGCEAYNSANQDGFKTGRGSRGLRIADCYAKGNNQDGFDTYDGFVNSVMSDCVAEGNGLGGFQIKGTFGGAYSAGDYVSRDSAVTNCVARGNGAHGFAFQEARSLALSNLVASENATHGFLFNNTQGMTATGLIALRNALDGFNLQGNAARNTFNGCIAQDNSFTDGTAQSGVSHGFNLVDAGSNTFNGCQSFNGNQTGKLGGQKYGYNVNAASVNNTFTACYANGNTAGDTGAE